MRHHILLIAILVGALPTVSAPKPTTVSIEDGWFVVNGERFFVKGIGYELHGGPGQTPRERTFDPETMEYDMALLKQGGFNTVRAWNAYSDQELELLRRHGMMVIQGSWFDVGLYMRDEAYAKRSREALAKVVRAGKRFDHILFYTIMNEPHADTIIKAGLDAYYQACREMKAVAKQEDPDCLVAYSHCSRNEFLDESMWDLVFFNDYMYAPNTVSTSLKYRGHVEWLRRMHASRKPFVLGEFGLAVSKKGPGKMGYGGNTLADRRDGDLHMYQAMIDAGAQGGCLFMWKDGWWKHGNRMIHDDHAEEWFGVLGIDTLESDPRGTPRPVYHAFRKYNQLILTEPRQMVVYPGPVPVDAFVTENVRSVRCRLDDGPWIELEASSTSWRQTSLSKLAKGRHTVEVEARLGLDDIKEIRRSVEIVVGDPERALPKLTLTTNKAAYTYGDTVAVQVRVTKGDGAPVPDLTLVGTYQNHYNGEAPTFKGKTDAKGSFRTSFPVFAKPTFITLAFGADTETHGVAHRLSDATIIEVTGLPEAEIEKAVQGEGRLVAGFEYGTKAELARTLGRVLGGAASYAVERETENVKQGAAALALRFRPKARGSWGYAEVLFKDTQDISQAKALTYWVHGDGSRHALKTMWIDQDGERWHDDAITLDFKGWRRITIASQTPQRDPHDGIKDGDARPNPDRVRGLAFAMVAKSAKTSAILIDAVSAHK